MRLFDCFVAFIFGIVEGITEWLPISSTGHMIILNEILKLNVSENFFDIFLVVIQIGAILAVIILFWNDIFPFGKKYNKKPLTRGGLLSWFKADVFAMWFKIIVACIPAVIVGLLFDDLVDKYLYNATVVAIALIVFGVAFIITEFCLKNRTPRCKKIEEITFIDALIIGLFQVLAAVFPGASRSGTTILGSLIIGISRETSAKFTFFLAIPVMFGASVLKLLKYEYPITTQEIVLLGIGTISAFIVSMFVIKFLLGFIRKHDFKAFGIYRIILGITVLVFFNFINK